MNKLKKLSLISILITFVMSLLSVVTLKIVPLNGFFIFGAIASFALALFYMYLIRARQTFNKDLLDNLK